MYAESTTTATPQVDIYRRNIRRNRAGNGAGRGEYLTIGTPATGSQYSGRFIALKG
jgi:hypothetical protein